MYEQLLIQNILTNISLQFTQTFLNDIISRKRIISNKNLYVLKKKKKKEGLKSNVEHHNHSQIRRNKKKKNNHPTIPFKIPREFKSPVQ